MRPPDPDELSRYFAAIFLGEKQKLLMCLPILIPDAIILANMRSGKLRTPNIPFLLTRVLSIAGISLSPNAEANQRPVLRSRDLSGPIRGQHLSLNGGQMYPGVGGQRWAVAWASQTYCGR